MDWQTIISYMDWKAIISLISIAISIASLYVSRKSWSESNRPMITVKIHKNNSSGNNAILFDLVVENTGNRPAKEIKLDADQPALKRAYHQNIDNYDKEIIQECFNENGVIPILANGEYVKNFFGQVYFVQTTRTLAAKAKNFQNNSSKSSWKPFSKFNITVQYQDLDGRKYKDIMPVVITDNKNGFAGVAWNS